MKKNKTSIIIVALLMLGVMAIILITFLAKAKEDFPNDIFVDEGGQIEKIWEIKDLYLAPTQSKEYSVNLFCAASGVYNITLDYEEVKDGRMKAFVDVTVKSNGVTIYEGKLAELLKDDVQLQFEEKLRSKKEEPVVISISYAMSGNVGNEAQGVYSEFDIHFKIKKK